MRIITDIEVVYSFFLSQVGADDAPGICSAAEEQAQQRMLEAIGRLGVDRTVVRAVWWWRTGAESATAEAPQTWLAV